MSHAHWLTERYRRHINPTAEISFTTSLALATTAAMLALVELFAPLEQAAGMMWASGFYFAIGLSAVSWRGDAAFRTRYDGTRVAPTTHGKPIRLRRQSKCHVRRPAA